MTPTRYNKRSVVRVIAEITAWRDQTEVTLATEESRDYPNDDRLDALSERLDALTAAIEALEDIE